MKTDKIGGIKREDKLSSIKSTFDRKTPWVKGEAKERAKAKVLVETIG